MKLKEQYGGEWIQPRRKNYYVGCCDCGLIHRVNFRLIKDKLKRGTIQFQAFRCTKTNDKEIENGLEVWCENWCNRELCYDHRKKIGDENYTCKNCDAFKDLKRIFGIKKKREKRR